MGSNFVDEIDCGSFFDHIGDIIEFSPDNNIDLGSGSCNDFPSIWTNTSDSILDSDAIFAGRNRNASASDLSAELAVPYEDIMQLEWLSTFVEDSFSGGSMTLNKDIIPANNVESHNQFRTSSPVSVLESSSSSSGSEGKHILHSATQRARSKRPRPATFNPHSAMQVISPNSASDSPRLFIPIIMSSEPEKLAESQQKLVPAPGSKKKKKPKMSFPPDSMETNHSSPSQEAVRKCTHCGITKTPQWRAGPMGPKTLCNACGVRYKSGRLFPEYRPAASPTFTPSLHSNSHRKVIAMRTKGTEKNIMTDRILLPTTPEPELIPNLSAAVNCMSESRPGFDIPISPSSGFIC